MQSFFDGAQLPGAAMDAIAAASPEKFFASEAYMTQRVEQVKISSGQSSPGTVPVARPASGHGRVDRS